MRVAWWISWISLVSEAVRGGLVTVLWGESVGAPEGFAATELTGRRVRQVASNAKATAVLSETGEVYTFGAASHGGDSSSVDLKNVAKLVAGADSFLAVKTDGSIVIWSAEQVQTPDVRLVKDAASSGEAFAVLKEDETVEAFGEGPSADLSQVRDSLEGIVKLTGSQGAFAAVDWTGSVVACWGRKERCSEFPFHASMVSSAASNAVFCNSRACAMISFFLGIIGWGDTSSGAVPMPTEDDGACKSQWTVTGAVSERAICLVCNEDGVHCNGDPRAGGLLPQRGRGKQFSKLASTLSSFCGLEREALFCWGDGFPDEGYLWEGRVSDVFGSAATFLVVLASGETVSFKPGQEKRAFLRRLIEQDTTVMALMEKIQVESVASLENGFVVVGVLEENDTLGVAGTEKSAWETTAIALGSFVGVCFTIAMAVIYRRQVRGESGFLALPKRKTHHIYLSYAEDKSTLSKTLKDCMEIVGLQCARADDPGTPSQEMACAFVLLLTAGVFESARVLEEFAAAVACKLPIILIHEEDFDFGNPAFSTQCSQDIKMHVVPVLFRVQHSLQVPTDLDELLALEQERQKEESNHEGQADAETPDRTQLESFLQVVLSRYKRRASFRLRNLERQDMGVDPLEMSTLKL